MNNKSVEVGVGLLMLLALIAFVVLSIKVSGLSDYAPGNTYPVIADFDNIGGLKVRAPVRIAGVRVGEVGDIQLNPKTYQARVTLLLYADNRQQLPADTSASILTEGLLGSNYISLTPGFDTTSLKRGDTIKETHSAIILENMVSHLLFSQNDGEKGN